MFRTIQAFLCLLLVTLGLVASSFFAHAAPRVNTGCLQLASHQTTQRSTMPYTMQRPCRMTNSGRSTRVLAAIFGPASKALVIDQKTRPATASIVLNISQNTSPQGDPSGYCPNSSQLVQVKQGETLSGIALRVGISSMELAIANRLADPNVLQIGQRLCIPTQRSLSDMNALSVSPAHSVPEAASAQANLFPSGQCTWWANQRYFQLHGVYVPWSMNADAWQWTARAYDFGWHVSLQPSVGAIVVLQPWVQGAYGRGHVAVVEKVMSDGTALTSNLNWGNHPDLVAYAQVAPGPGVTFLSETL